MSDKANDNTNDDIVLAANGLARLLDLQGYRHVTVALKPGQLSPSDKYKET